MQATSVRRYLASSLHAVSLWSGHGMRRALALRAPRILMYHGVGPAPGDVTPELLAWQLRLLRDNFDLVSLREMLRRRAEGRLSNAEVVVTFDDGVRNHASTAYPILREFGAPATFFVCPGLIASGRWIWNTELRGRLRRLSAPDRAALAAEIGSDGDAIEDLIERAKRLPLDQRRAAEDWVARRTRAFAPTDRESDRYAPLSWEQIEALDPALITIGSHTLEHPILPTLSVEGLEREIGESRRLLERRLAREVELFCYPNGDNDARAQAIVRKHYAAAVTTVPSAVAPGDDVCLLPRIPAGATRRMFLRRLHRHTA